MSTVSFRHRLAIGIAFFANGALFALWVSRIPSVKYAAGLSDASLGVALFALGAGMFGALPLTAWLVARFGSHRITFAMAVAACAALPLAGWMRSLSTLSAALVVFGAAMSALDVAMNAQASSLEKRVGRSIMSAFHGVWSVGAWIGASLGGAFADRGLSPLLQFVCVNAVLLLFVVPSARWLLRDERASSASEPVLAWPTRAVLGIGLIGACGGMVEGGVGDWSALYLHESLGTGTGFAAAGYAGFALAMAVGRFLADRLIDRFGAIAVLRAGVGIAAGAIVVALSTDNPYIAVAAFTLTGFGMAPVFPIAFSAAGNVRGMAHSSAIAAAATMAYGGTVIGPPIIGFSAEVVSLRGALILLVVLSVAMLCLSRQVAAHPSVERRRTQGGA